MRSLAEQCAITVLSDIIYRSDKSIDMITRAMESGIYNRTQLNKVKDIIRKIDADITVYEKNQRIINFAQSIGSSFLDLESSTVHADGITFKFKSDSFLIIFLDREYGFDNDRLDKVIKKYSKYKDQVTFINKIRKMLGKSALNIADEIAAMEKFKKPSVEKTEEEHAATIFTDTEHKEVFENSASDVPGLVPAAYVFIGKAESKTAEDKTEDTMSETKDRVSEMDTDIDHDFFEHAEEKYQIEDDTPETKDDESKMEYHSYEMKDDASEMDTDIDRRLL